MKSIERDIAGWASEDGSGMSKGLPVPRDEKTKFHAPFPNLINLILNRILKQKVGKMITQ